MELLLGLVAIVLVIGMFMPWFHMVSIREMRKDMDDMLARLRVLERGVVKAAAPAEPEREEPVDYAPPVRVVPVTQAQQPTKSALPPIVYASRPAKEPKPVAEKSKEQGLEFNLTARLPVWIGAVALACAAFYLVRYSIEAGWFSPAVRVVGGGLFGAVLTMVGDHIGRAKRMANHERVAQGLVGAGLAAMYGAFYASVSVYGFLSPLMGVVCMTAVTLGAVVMALRHGQPIAVFGLAAGIMVPALVGSDDPQATLLFSHLFIVFASGLVILARKGWWILAGAALAGMYGWCALWMVNGGGEERVLILFVMALAGAVAVATMKVRGQMQTVALNIAAIAGAALLIAAANSVAPLGLFDWAMTGVLSLGLIAMATFKESHYRGLLLCKAALDMAVLYMWAQDAQALEVGVLVAGFAVLYVALPQVLMGRVRDPRFWALLQGAATASLYAIAHAHMPEMGDTPWIVAAFALAAVAILRVRSFMKDESEVGEHMTAIYTAGAVGFIATGLCLALPVEVLAATLAVKAALLLWLHRRTAIAALPPLALLVAAGVFAVLRHHVFDLLMLVGEAIAQDNSSFVLRPGMFQDLLLPGLALLAGAVVYTGESRTVKNVFYGFALFLLTGFLYHAAASLPLVPFIGRGFFDAAVAGMGIALVYAGGTMRLWGRVLVGAVVVRIAYLDLLMANPYFNDIAVGSMPLLNGVTLVYGIGAVLCMVAAQSARMGHSQGVRNIYNATGFAMLFALVSLTIRQAAQGGVLSGDDMGSMEFYGYSVAWLMTGLALLACGMFARSRAAHIAAALFVALCVGKVFIYDAAALDGLYRVFSFFGLGLSLMGLSVFYTRYAARAKARDGEQRS